MNQIRVLIADDHAVVRKGIQMIIGTEPTIQVVGEAKNGSEAVYQAQRLQPDVILLDLVMPDEDGLEAFGRFGESGQGKGQESQEAGHSFHVRECADLP